jgi:hypothetical protein
MRQRQPNDKYYDGNTNVEAAAHHGNIQHHNLADEMEAFDSLPKDVREFLNHAIYRAAAIEAKMVLTKHAPDFYIRAAKRTLISMATIDRKKVWNVDDEGNTPAPVEKITPPRKDRRFK